MEIYNFMMNWNLSIQFKIIHAKIEISMNGKKKQDKNYQLRKYINF